MSVQTARAVAAASSGNSGEPEGPWTQLLQVLGGAKKKSKRRASKPVAYSEPTLDVSLAVKTLAFNKAEGELETNNSERKAGSGGGATTAAAVGSTNGEWTGGSCTAASAVPVSQSSSVESGHTAPTPKSPELASADQQEHLDLPSLGNAQPMAAQHVFTPFSEAPCARSPFANPAQALHTRDSTPVLTSSNQGSFDDRRGSGSFLSQGAAGYAPGTPLGGCTPKGSGVLGEAVHLPAAAGLWSHGDWALVAKALDWSSSEPSTARVALSDSEKSRARVMLHQLMTFSGPQVHQGSSVSRRFSEVSRDLHRNTSVKSFSSEGNDVAAEYHREAAWGAPDSQPGSNHSGSRSSVFSSSGPLASCSSGSLGPSSSGSGPLTVLDSSRLQSLETAAAAAVTLCGSDRSPNGNRVCEFLLDKVMESTQSRMGFIGSIHFRTNGAAYVKMHAITNVSWTAQLQKFYMEKKDSGLVFSNMDTLFGSVVRTGKLVLCNDPSTDPRSSGTPPGHPKIRCFLGLPLYLHGKPIGALGLANRSGGYSEEMAKQLHPYIQVVAEALGHYLGLEKMPGEAPVETHGAPAQIARDVFLAFDASGVCSTMNRPAEMLFGQRVGEHVALLFVSLANGEVEPGPEGLEALAARGNKVRAEGMKKDFEVGKFEIQVSHGVTEDNKFVVTLWVPQAQGHAHAQSLSSSFASGSGQLTAAAAPSPARSSSGPMSRPGYAAGAPAQEKGQSAAAAPAAEGAEANLERQASSAAPAGPVPASTGPQEPAQAPQGSDGGAPSSGPVPSKKVARKVVGAAMRAYEIFEADDTPNARIVSDFLLSQLLSITESAMGLIGTVHYRPNGAAYIKTHSITNIAWTPELKTWYTENSEKGLVYSNTNTLFGAVVLPPLEPIITNDAPSHPKSTGTPPGHPVLRSFFGVPLFYGSEVIGLYCLANSKCGYSRATLETLAPLTKAIADVLARHLGPGGSEGGSDTSSSGTLEQRTRASETLEEEIVEKEVALNVSRLSISLPSQDPPGATSAPMSSSRTGDVCPWEFHGENGNPNAVQLTPQGAKGPNAPYPAEWMSDVGPLACPYLAHQGQAQNFQATQNCAPRNPWGREDDIMRQVVNEAREELLMSYVAQAEEFLEKDKTPNGTKVANFLLDGFLELTHSKMGFIASAHYKANGAPYIKTHAITNIAWTPALHQWYTDNHAGGLVFSNLNTLFGAIVVEASLIVCNDPTTDARASGTPPGHLTVNCFLGIPLFAGNELIGAVGVANRPGGYTASMAEELQPLIESTANIVHNILLRMPQKKNPSKFQVNASDALLAFDSTGQLSSLNKPAESVFGPRSGYGRTEFSDLFSSVAGIAARMDTEGLEILVNSNEKLPAVARRSNGAELEVEIRVTRGMSNMSRYVVTAWPRS